MHNKKFVRVVCIILAVVMVFCLLIVGAGSMTAGAISQKDLPRKPCFAKEQLKLHQILCQLLPAGCVFAGFAASNIQADLHAQSQRRKPFPRNAAEAFDVMRYVRKI